MDGVEQLASPDAIQHWVIPVVHHVMCRDGRQSVPLQRVDTPLQFDGVLLQQKIGCGRKFSLQADLVQSLAHLLLNAVDGFTKTLGDGGPSQALHVEVVGFGRENHKCNHGGVRVGRLQVVVEPGQRLDEHVGALVAELVAAGNEEVKSFVQVKIVVAVEVAPGEVVDFLLGHGVQILELVQGAELFDVEAVGGDEVGFPLEQVLSLETGHLRHRGENVA